MYKLSVYSIRAYIFTFQNKFIRFMSYFFIANNWEYFFTNHYSFTPLYSSIFTLNVVKSMTFKIACAVSKLVKLIVACSTASRRILNPSERSVEHTSELQSRGHI